jgi:hypothetical protein
MALPSQSPGDLDHTQPRTVPQGFKPLSGIATEVGKSQRLNFWVIGISASRPQVIKCGFSWEQLPKGNAGGCTPLHSSQKKYFKDIFM